MTLSTFTALLIGGSVTGLVCAAIYAAIVVAVERPPLNKIIAALRGQGFNSVDMGDTK